MRIAALLLAAIMLFGSSAARAQEKLRTVNTSGDATVFVTPDEVVVGIGVETFAPKLDKVKADNDAACAKLLKAIAELGVESKHVQTDTLQIEIKYNESSHPSRGIEGFFARRQYSVTLKDVKLFEKLISAAIENGANQILGIEYRTQELRKHRDEARKLAIRAAQEKAKALATELGSDLGNVRTISESSGYQYWGGRNAFSNNSQVQVSATDGGDSGETTPLGQLAVRATVSVVFDLK